MRSTPNFVVGEKLVIDDKPSKLEYRATLMSAKAYHHPVHYPNGSEFYLIQAESPTQYTDAKQLGVPDEFQGLDNLHWLHKAYLFIDDDDPYEIDE